MKSVNWQHSMHIGHMPGEGAKHFIAIREGDFYLGKSADDSVYAIIELDRDTVVWMINALQKELTLAQAREN